jgi:ATP/maltotriose-dependent transcriptional regulator MalT
VADAGRARDMASEQDYQRGLARAYLTLAGARLDLGDLDGARAGCSSALELSNSRGYPLTVANALTMLATIDQRAGDREAAVEHGQRALDEHLRTGHRLGEARTLQLLSQLTS